MKPLVVFQPAVLRAGLALFATISFVVPMSPSHSQTLDEQERCANRAKLVLDIDRKSIDAFVSAVTKRTSDYDNISSKLDLDMVHYNTKLRKCLMLTTLDGRTGGDEPHYLWSHEVHYLLRDAYEDRVYAEATNKFQSALDDVVGDKPIKPPIVEGWVSMGLGEHSNKRYEDITAFYRELEPLLTE
jgi:hypothetical protein